MYRILLSDYTIAAGYVFDAIPKGMITVNTINAYSWVMADKDQIFRRSLRESDYLLPDGIAIVWAARFLRKERIKKIVVKLSMVSSVTRKKLNYIGIHI